MRDRSKQPSAGDLVLTEGREGDARLEAEPQPVSSGTGCVWEQK